MHSISFFPNDFHLQYLTMAPTRATCPSLPQKAGKLSSHLGLRCLETSSQTRTPVVTEVLPLPAALHGPVLSGLPASTTGTSLVELAGFLSNTRPRDRRGHFWAGSEG